MISAPGDFSQEEDFSLCHLTDVLGFMSFFPFADFLVVAHLVALLADDILSRAVQPPPCKIITMDIRNKDELK